MTWEGRGGTNSVTRILDGHVIQERFIGVPADEEERPLHGLSLSVYVPTLDRWRRTWVDNTGAFLVFIGAFDEGKMRLATERVVDGKPRTQRMTFYNISASALDWDWERSEDGGQTWGVLWRIHYQRRP